ncbi:MAG: hypothetical protein RLZZ412_926 [Verrucomicrobiota bacterium]
MNQALPPVPSVRRGFSLIEVTLAIGILGLAILSLVGILSATFSQVSEIMDTNRALSGVTRLIGALDNPRSIVYIPAGDAAATNTKFLHQGVPTIDPAPGGAPNFDLAYRLLNQATTPVNAVWLYVYDRRSVGLERASRVTGGTETFDITSNPSSMEVAFVSDRNFTFDMASQRNVIGAPMRVRLTLSRLLVGQRTSVDLTTSEPSAARYALGGALPADPSGYALAYLPIVAEFFPHDYAAPSGPTGFQTVEQTPLLIQNIVINR